MNDKETNVKYLYVLDFCICNIVEIAVYGETENIEINDVLEAHGMQEDQCNYMWSSKKLNIEEEKFIVTK